MPRAAYRGYIDFNDNGLWERGLAAQFTSANGESLSRADNASLSTGNINFSGGIWFYIEDTFGSSFPAIMGKWNSSGDNREYLVFIDEPSGLIAFTVSADGTNGTRTTRTAATFGALSLNTWHFVYFEHDAVADTLGISVNNTNLDTSNHSTGATDLTADFILGAADQGSTNLFGGRLVSAAFWKRILTIAERRFLFNNGLGRRYADIGLADDGSDLKTSLEAWWNLDEEHGTRVDFHGANSLADNNTVTSVASELFFDEVVDDDIRRLTWSRGKRLDKQRAEAAVTDWFLNNENHRYSPSNSSSPLFPGNIPAPHVWMLIGYPVDDFNVADNATLAARRPSHDELFAAWAGQTTNFKVTSNEIGPSTGGNVSASLDFGLADCYVGAEITRSSTGAGLVLRRSDSDNYISIHYTGTQIALGAVVAGTLSTNLGSATIPWSTGTKRWVFARMHGTAIRVYVDDTLQFTATSTFNSTRSAHGIGGRGLTTDDRWDNFGGWVSKFKGRIDTIQPRPELGNQYAFLQSFDDMERMSRHQVFRNAPTGSTSNVARNIIEVVLDAIRDDTNQSTAGRLLDDGTNLTRSANHEKSMGRDALAETYQIQDDDVGFFHIDGFGNYVYEGSTHRDTVPHTTVKAAWRDDRLGASDTDIFFQELSWDDGKERVENEIYYKYARISLTSSAVVVWQLDSGTTLSGDRPRVGANDTISFLAIGDEINIANPIAPVPTTDYTINTEKGGAGSDLTGNATATLRTGFDGNFQSINIVNGGTPGFVTFLRLRGTKGTQSSVTAARSEAPESQRNVGRRRIEHTSLHIDRFGTDSGGVGFQGSAQDRADERRRQRGLAKEKLVIGMANATRASLMEILHREISDRVAITYARMGIDDEYVIEKQSVDIGDGGQVVFCEWELQQSIGMPWDRTRWNVNSWA